MARKNDEGCYKTNRVARVDGEEGDFRVVVIGKQHARVVPISNPGDGVDPGPGRLVKTEDLRDVRRSYDVTTGKRQVVTLPRDLCRHLGIEEGTPLRIVEHARHFEIIPMRLVPALDEASPILADLLAQITPENRHGEIDTGAPVGAEEC